MNEENNMSLSDWIILESKNENYDCPMAMISACDKYYKLGYDQKVMDMMAGFGEGMFIHKTCGALIGAAAVLSTLVHQSTEQGKPVDLEKAMQALIANFRSINRMDSLNCEDIKPKNWAGKDRFVRTDVIAGQALQTTIRDLGIQVQA